MWASWENDKEEWGRGWRWRYSTDQGISQFLSHPGSTQVTEDRIELAHKVIVRMNFETVTPRTQGALNKCQLIIFYY